MKYLTGLAIIIGTTMLSSSCIKHEVIPAPSPMVDLPASFSAILEGNTYELINDVDGFYCKATQSLEINPTPQPSSAIYYSGIKSDEKLDYIQIGVGKLNFNADINSIPNLESFTNYFKDMTPPPFSKDALNGVEIIYRDGNNNPWISDENMGDPQSFDFTTVRQESDEDGDYIIFTANFSVSLVDNIDNPTDTIRFDNAVFKGYFKRQNN